MQRVRCPRRSPDLDAIRIIRLGALRIAASAHREIHVRTARRHSPGSREQLADLIQRLRDAVPTPCRMATLPVMPVVFAVAAFLGAWLLVAGPVYQAAVELTTEQVDRELVAAADASVPRATPVSRWWWLLPPAAIVLRARATRAHRRAVLEVMPIDQVTRLLEFGAKATGWLVVALGAALIGTRETWELTELLHWPAWAFATLLVIGLAGALTYGPLRLRRDHRLLDSRRRVARPMPPAPEAAASL